MLDRFTNPTNRNQEKKNLEKEVDNAKYWELLAMNHAKGAVNMQRLERRMIKAEKIELKKKYDEQRGLANVQGGLNDSYGESSAYHSSNSDSNSTDEEKKEE